MSVNGFPTVISFEEAIRFSNFAAKIEKIQQIVFITVWQKCRVLRKKNRSSRSWLNYIAGRKKEILNYVQVAKLYWIMLTHAWTVVLSAKTRQPARSVRSIAISRPCGNRCVKYCASAVHVCFFMIRLRLSDISSTDKYN